MTPKPPPQPLGLLRRALALTWLATALVSAIEWQGQSASLLRQAGILDTTLQHALVGGGIAVDLAFGLGLACRPGRLTYGAALLGMTAMTIVATLLLPSLWLDPLGPLLKNLPIGAALLLLMRQDAR